MFKKIIPVLPAADISNTIEFYVSKLGFQAVNYGNYAVLKYEQTEIHLLMKRVPGNLLQGSCLVMVDNIEDLYTSFCSRGLITMKGKLEAQPWGLKEFSITDNNNNLIRFGAKR